MGPLVPSDNYSHHVQSPESEYESTSICRNDKRVTERRFFVPLRLGRNLRIIECARLVTVSSTSEPHHVKRALGFFFNQNVYFVFSEYT